MRGVRLYMAALYVGFLATCAWAVIGGSHSRWVDSHHEGTVPSGIVAGLEFGEIRIWEEEQAEHLHGWAVYRDMHVSRARAAETAEHGSWAYLGCVAAGALVGIAAVLRRSHRWVRVGSLVAACALSAAGLWIYHNSVLEFLLHYKTYPPLERLVLTSFPRIRLVLWGTIALLAILVGLLADWSAQAPASARPDSRPA